MPGINAQPSSACFAVIREACACTSGCTAPSSKRQHPSAFERTCTLSCRPDLVVGHGTHHIVGSHRPGKLVIELENKQVSSRIAAGHPTQRRGSADAAMLS